MKITIDTGRKTVVVHGEAAFEEIVGIVKMVAPEEWESYRLTCENVYIADYNTIGIAIQKKAMFDSLPSITAQIPRGATITNCKSRYVIHPDPDLRHFDTTCKK